MACPVDSASRRSPPSIASAFSPRAASASICRVLHALHRCGRPPRSFDAQRSQRAQASTAYGEPLDHPTLVDFLLGVVQVSSLAKLRLTQDDGLLRDVACDRPTVRHTLTITVRGNHSGACWHRRCGPSAPARAERSTRPLERSASVSDSTFKDANAVASGAPRAAITAITAVSGSAASAVQVRARTGADRSVRAVGDGALSTTRRRADSIAARASRNRVR